MEFSLNIVMDDDATERDLARALEAAANAYAELLRVRHSGNTYSQPLACDNCLSQEVAAAKLQDATFWRHA